MPPAALTPRTAGLSPAQIVGQVHRQACDSLASARSHNLGRDELKRFSRADVVVASCT
jgi:hypothetical protein